MISPKKIKVLVVDDSAVARAMLTRELAKDPQIEVVGAAPDPFVARDKILELKPDVLTLDLEMPRMDGITFLKRLMEYYPIPVVVVSSLTPRGSDLALEALAEGAIEVVGKTSTAYAIGDIGTELVEKVKMAAKVKVSKREKKSDSDAQSNSSSISPKSSPSAIGHSVKLSMTKTTQKIIAIGASTGGVHALQVILSALPHDAPGILVVQHMPEQFTAAFAERMNAECDLNICEAKDGDRVLSGKVLIAPGNHHMYLRRSGSLYEVKLDQAPRVSMHRPSVDVLFESCAQYAGRNAVGVILTGMGADGAAGLLKMKEQGARTMAQDEESCVVFGMPKEAIERGAVDYIVPLNEIAAKMISLANLD